MRFVEKWSPAPVRSLLGKRISPFTTADGGSSPMMASDVIDFPDPDSPTKPSTSPGATENEIPLTAATGAAPFSGTAPRDGGNWIARFRTSSSGHTKDMVTARAQHATDFRGMKPLCYWDR